jgi:hypothetical protein
MFESVSDALVLALSGHIGHDNRISRDDLRLRVSDILERPISDRDMREAIEQLRATSRGATICSANGRPRVSGSGGYFLARDQAELDHYIRQDEHRALTTLKRLRRQRLAAGMKLAGVSMLPIEGL